MVELRPDTLGQVQIPVPTYDRAAVVPGIIHFGVGAFHRAHQAYFLDAVLNLGHTEWGIVGVGLLPGDQGTRQAASPQSGLYTLTTVSPDETQRTQVLGSILDVVFAPDDPGRVLDLLAAPSTRIVSLTITEGGYGVDDVTGTFAPTDPLTVADLAGGDAPQSVWGYLTEALRRRRQAGVAPFTVMSCDNIQSNGRIARLALTSFARTRDPELADWMGAELSFPSSMVDRITPVVTPSVSIDVADRTGVVDHWPVRSESFIQWVLEDDFVNGRPPLEEVGVQVVNDVVPYEHLKLRLLNASHQVMSYLGLLAGFDQVDEVCRAEPFRSFVLRYLQREAIPTLGEVPGIDPFTYADQLLERFSSGAVRDTLARQVVDGSDRLPKFLLPVLRDQLATDGSIECCVMTLAAWSVHVERHLAEGAPPLTDRRAADLLSVAVQESREPGAFLRYAPMFGDLGENQDFVDAWLGARGRIAGLGAAGATAQLLAGTPVSQS